MAVIELTDGRPDGTRLGQNSSDKIGFYGSAPVAKTTVTALATTAAVFEAATTSTYGFASSTVAAELDANVRAMHTALKALGLI